MSRQKPALGSRWTVPDAKQRLALIAELLEWLDSGDDLVPMEVLRSARLVVGWSFTRGNHGTFAVDAPERAGLVMTREATLMFLRLRWVPQARVVLASVRAAAELAAAELAAPEEKEIDSSSDS